MIGFQAILGLKGSGLPGSAFLLAVRRGGERGAPRWPPPCSLVLFLAFPVLRVFPKTVLFL